jgi:hypothetical protein
MPRARPEAARGRELDEIFLKEGERGLKARTEDEQATHDREVRELRAKVGELVLELDARKKLEALTGKPDNAF